MQACRWGYPQPRLRGPDRGPGQPERYERVEAMAAEQTTDDTMTTAITFSGRADAVRLSARTASIRFRLGDRLDRETHFVVVLAGNTEELRVPCERVAVQSLVAATAGSAHVVGLWASAAEYSTGAEARGNDAA
jgi:hypothetical protein